MEKEFINTVDLILSHCKSKSKMSDTDLGNDILEIFPELNRNVLNAVICSYRNLTQTEEFTEPSEENYSEVIENYFKLVMDRVVNEISSCHTVKEDGNSISVSFNNWDLAKLVNKVMNEENVPEVVKIIISGPIIKKSQFLHQMTLEFLKGNE